MSYRTEMEALILELHRLADAAPDTDLREKYRRQAEVLDFLVHHPKDALANLETE